MSRRRSEMAILALVAGLSVFTALSQAQMPAPTRPGTKAPTTAQRSEPAKGGFCHYHFWVDGTRHRGNSLNDNGDKFCDLHLY
jgi:hypothetical protein